ncbi:MAG: response regulator transcription factor [Spirochaetaceae bacterium]|nr:response regulator transcription factor [Spirochaetaceae bacterium]
MINIIVIEGQETNLNDIRARLLLEPEFAVRGFGKDGYDALRLVETCRPDIAILDICLDETSGPDLMPLLKRKSPDTAFLFLTSKNDERSLCSIVSRDEVCGYLFRDADMDSLVFAVRRVYNGGRYISASLNELVYRILAKLLDTARDYPTATPRSGGKTVLAANLSKIELKILTLVGRGYSTRVIAENLGLSNGTVRNYISFAMRKSGLSRRTQIPLFAIQNGMINV